jgi:nucleotidyltransferase substrate binding protein (TIGR01987 family)
MIFDFTSLRLSIDSLRRASAVYNEQSVLHGAHSDLMHTLAAGVIQNFEFTYEQCWKFMKRWLDEHVGPSVADGVTRRELFRLSAESKLIDDVEQWMTFHRSRNLTSHTYSVEISDEVLSVSIMFIPHAQDLLARLEARNQ